MDQTTKPEWWPDWMIPNGTYQRLGKCMDCGAQQYSMSNRESHMSDCKRNEGLTEPGPFRKVPWSRGYGK